MKDFFWFVKRWYKEFTCKHTNAQRDWNDGEGWHIVVCTKCHRARINFGDHKNVEDL